MAGENQGANWPLPKFYFSVDLGDMGVVSFQEVTGLDASSEPIEYRAGNSKSWNTIKMPGVKNSGNVTLKKGIFVNSSKFFDWCSQIQLNIIKRQQVTISMLDQEDRATMVWKLANAWPFKITSPDLTSNGHEVAVETIELAHEGFTIGNGG